MLAPTVMVLLNTALDLVKVEIVISIVSFEKAVLVMLVVCGCSQTAIMNRLSYPWKELNLKDINYTTGSELNPLLCKPTQTVRVI